MNKYDIAILGAGISGLSLAHLCAKKGFKVLLLEKDKRIGGCLHSPQFDDFWIELGAHTCYNSYTGLIKILEDCHATNLIIARQKVPFKMLINGNIKSIISQLNILEILGSFPKIFFIKKRGTAVSSYYRSIIGKRNYEKVLRPAIKAVLSQEVDDFPTDLLFKKRKRRKDILKKFTFKNGLQTIANIIESQENISIIKEENVTSINYEKERFYLFTDNNSFESSFLALSIPPSEASMLLKMPFPNISNLLSTIKISRVNTTGVIIRKRFIKNFPQFAGLIPLSDNFYSVVSRDTIEHSEFRGFTFHFKPDITDHNLRIKRVSDLLRINLKQIEHIIEKENIVPSLKVGHNDLIRKIDEQLSKIPLFLTGNYFEGMAIEDCILRSKKEYERLISF